MHHFSGISIQRGGRTPPQWNIFPQGGGYTTSVEYLSTGGGGGHHLNGIFIQRVGVHHLSGIFIQRGGDTPPRWNIYAEGGCTATQWNIYPHGGGVHHLGGIFIQRGGGTPPQWNIYPEGGGWYTTSVEYFSWPPIFPNASFFHPFFFFGGGCSPVLHGLPFFPTFNFHDGFFSGGWLCCGGGVAHFYLSLSEMKEGREGSGTTLLSDFC